MVRDLWHEPPNQNKCIDPYTTDQCETHATARHRREGRLQLQVDDDQARRRSRRLFLCSRRSRKRHRAVQARSPAPNATTSGSRYQTAVDRASDGDPCCCEPALTRRKRSRRTYKKYVIRGYVAIRGKRLSRVGEPCTCSTAATAPPFPHRRGRRQGKSARLHRAQLSRRDPEDFYMNATAFSSSMPRRRSTTSRSRVRKDGADGSRQVAPASNADPHQDGHVASGWKSPHTWSCATA